MGRVGGGGGIEVHMYQCSMFCVRPLFTMLMYNNKCTRFPSLDSSRLERDSTACAMSLTVGVCNLDR